MTITFSTTAPADHRDLTPATYHLLCVCGVIFGRHFDGWDGNALSCDEAQARNGVVPPAAPWTPELDEPYTAARAAAFDVREDDGASLEDDGRPEEDFGSTCSIHCGYCGMCS